MELLARYLDAGILTVLGLMSLASLSFAIERWIHFRRVDVASHRQLASLELELARGLTVIATIASNAPYVGLLGTVFGIMLTFHEIGRSGQIDAASVMTGLALALKATALGLLVAIPSMMSYNGLVARAEALRAHWKIAHGAID